MAGDKPGRKLLLTPEIAKRILENLSDGTPPFIALAAERAGVSRSQVKCWIESGEAEHCPLRTPFARAVREIRATWMARVSAELMMADKMNAEAARQKAWLLERLDREMFSQPREYPQKPAKEAKPAAPAPAPAMTKQVEADLAQPELDAKPPVH